MVGWIRRLFADWLGDPVQARASVLPCGVMLLLLGVLIGVCAFPLAAYLHSLLR